MTPNFSAWPGDMHAACVAAAAACRGIPLRRLHGAFGSRRRPGSWLGLEAGGRTWVYGRGLLFRGPPLGELSPLLARDDLRPVNRGAAQLTPDKQATKTALRDLGVSVPEGILVGGGRVAEAARFLERLGRPVCVKPNHGRRGGNAHVGVRGRDELSDIVSAAPGELIVEEVVAGDPVRFFYVHPHVVGVRIDRPASVLGDGGATIAELIAAKNAERERRALPGHVAITADADVVTFLAGQGLSLVSVPAAGRRVQLRGTSNIPTGGDALDCRDRLHPSYRTLVERACAAIPGLRLAAIDAVLAAMEQPAASDNHWILEINSAPGVVPFHFPWEGEPQDVCGALVERLCRGGW
jgi:D-alanine-D-alanine ligase-like ATP-grasp enzyme